MGQENGHLARGIVAGVVGGLVASWVMNEFMSNLGPPLQKPCKATRLRAATSHNHRMARNPTTRP